jgi:hypothetical protein
MPECTDSPGKQSGSDVRLDVLLTEVAQALDDWIVISAPEFCNEKHVAAARKRIRNKGGTLAYVTELRDRVRSARDRTVSSLNRPTRVWHLADLHLGNGAEDKECLRLDMEDCKR